MTEDEKGDAAAGMQNTTEYKIAAGTPTEKTAWEI
jgi:hypothetical protein